MRLYFGVVENVFLILELNVISEIFNVGNYRFEFVFFVSCQVLGVGPRLNYKTAFVEFLRYGKARFHRCFVFFAEIVLQFGKRVKFTCGNDFLFCFFVRNYRFERVHPFATNFRFAFFVF